MVLYLFIVEGMFKVPVYTLENYQDILERRYGEHDMSQWRNFLDVLQELDVNHLSQYAEQSAEYTQLEGFSDKIIALKLLFPRLWASDTYLRNQGKGSHAGIDVVLPQGTPLPSFSHGKVVRIKERDGETKDEGNCVVIQSGDVFFSYKHLDTILVDTDQIIARSDILGTCGRSGHSHQYHMHLQIDSAESPFYPYWSNQVSTVIKNTIDPIPFLQELFSFSHSFWDMPEDPKYQEAITYLNRKNIIQGKNKRISPNQLLSRWQLALIVHKLVQEKNLFRQLPIVYHTFVPYVDIENIDGDIKQVLKDLQKYGIMVGEHNQFSPHELVQGEELLALLGRLLFHLQDREEEGGAWYFSYYSYFLSHGYIAKNWSYIGSFLPRKEAFLVIYRVMSA